MAATDHLNKQQFPHNGGEALDKYLRPGDAIHGSNDPRARKYPKLGNEALDQTYKAAHPSR